MCGSSQQCLGAAIFGSSRVWEHQCVGAALIGSSSVYGSIQQCVGVALCGSSIVYGVAISVWEQLCV